MESEGNLHLHARWFDVAEALPTDERPVWAAIIDGKFGPIAIEARYYPESDSWTTGCDESERELRTTVYAWQEVIVPTIPDWVCALYEGVHRQKGKVVNDN